MWFRRKSRNRRLAREYVLDVKLRSSQVRAARIRMGAIALGFVFATVLCVFMLWRGGELLLNRLVYQNPAFAVQELDVQTDGVISGQQLRRWSGVKPGDNLLALDLVRVKRDLEMVSVIQSAAVERILPHTLRLRVVEREPVAQLNIPRPRASGGVELTVFYVDVDGYVMLPLEQQQRASNAPQAPEQLPIISGLNPNEVQAGRRIDSAQVQAALKLLAAFEHSQMAGLVELKRLEVSAPDVLVLTTGQGAEVTFSPAEPEQQLRRWQQVLELSQKVNKSIASLDLAVSNNVPAVLLEASALPPGTPKAPKPVRTKKKHV